MFQQQLIQEAEKRQSVLKKQAGSQEVEPLGGTPVRQITMTARTGELPEVVASICETHSTKCHDTYQVNASMAHSTLHSSN